MHGTTNILCSYYAYRLDGDLLWSRGYRYLLLHAGYCMAPWSAPYQSVGFSDDHAVTLPACFSTLKPRLPEIVEHYEIRNPVFHLPAIKHKFAENSLQYCLIKLINEEHSFSMMSDKVERTLTLFYSFKVCIKDIALQF